MDAKSISHSMMLQLNQLRLSSHLCDAFLYISQPEPVQIPAHTVVLSACSGYFRERILANQNKQQKHTFGIEGVQAFNVVQVLDFIYTGQILIQNEKDACLYGNIAEKLKISLLVEYCNKYLNGGNKQPDENSNSDSKNISHAVDMSNENNVTSAAPKRITVPSKKKYIYTLKQRGDIKNVNAAEEQESRHESQNNVLAAASKNLSIPPKKCITTKQKGAWNNVNAIDEYKSQTSEFHNYCSQESPIINTPVHVMYSSSSVHQEDGNSGDEDESVTHNLVLEDLYTRTNLVETNNGRPEIDSSATSQETLLSVLPISGQNNTFIAQEGDTFFLEEEGRVFMVTMKPPITTNHATVLANSGRHIIFDSNQTSSRVTTAFTISKTAIQTSAPVVQNAQENLMQAVHSTSKKLSQNHITLPHRVTGTSPGVSNALLAMNLVPSSYNVSNNVMGVTSSGTANIPSNLMLVSTPDNMAKVIAPAKPILQQNTAPVKVKLKATKKKTRKSRTQVETSTSDLPSIPEHDLQIADDEANSEASEEKEHHKIVSDLYKKGRTDTGHHQCEICQRIIKKNSNLFCHMKRKHPEAVPKCKYCGKCFTSIKRRDVHMILKCESNKVRDYYRCHKCSFTALTPKEVMKHFKDIHMEKCTSFICHVCNKELHSQYMYHEHLVNVHNVTDPQYHKPRSKIHVCPKCNFKTTLLAKLHDHDEFAHSGIVSHCNKCNKTFKVKRHLQKHLDTVHNNRQLYKCSLCSVTSVYLETIKSHQYTTHKMLAFPNQKLYKCLQCNYTHVKRCKVKYHESQVHSTSTYACKHCDKTFTRSLYLWRHQTVHTNVRKHVCHLCEFKTKTRALLKMHWQCRHSDERPYVCEGCGHASKTKCNLNKHWKHHCHLVVDPSLNLLEENIVGVDDLKHVDQLTDFME